jgi:hypothetical protein
MLEGYRELTRPTAGVSPRWAVKAVSRWGRTITGTEALFWTAWLLEVLGVVLANDKLYYGLIFLAGMLVMLIVVFLKDRL